MVKKQPTILITGAGKRIGAALAAHFAARGHALVLHYHRSAKEARALAASLRAQHGVAVTLVKADLARAEGLENFWHGLPPCQAMIHNAALFERDTLARLKPAQLQAHLQINFVAPLLLTQGFVNQLPTKSVGSVLILGDGVDGASIGPEFFSYAISKTAWRGALDVLASACVPQVRVNMLALGPTLRGAKETPAMYRRLAARAPLQRTGTVEEVCEAAAFLLQAPGVSGQVVSLANGHGLTSYRPRA